MQERFVDEKYILSTMGRSKWHGFFIKWSRLPYCFPSCAQLGSRCGIAASTGTIFDAIDLDEVFYSGCAKPLWV